MPSEFDLIRRYFERPVRRAELGVGDDCALLALPPGCTLAVSTDMLVEGRHFFAGADAHWLGHKTLAVNLSDLAAMGATPRYATLALALPAADERWIERFAAGFFHLADASGVELIGGDTTRGPLTLCVQIMGEVPAGQALRRDGAKPGDDIWVSGTLGDAALGLAHLNGEVALAADAAAFCVQRLQAPTPRVELGLALRGVASACIDLSDGLVGDLGHLLTRSACGAELWVDRLPESDAAAPHLGSPLGRSCALAGGDDYELCFTAPAGSRAAIGAISRALRLPLTRIGRISAGAGMALLDAAGHPIDLEVRGFDHFSD